MKKVLIISAHPDDDILGCGGIMAKYDTIEFRVIFIAEGSSCRFEKHDLDNPDIENAIEVRKKASIEALDLLGVKNYKFYDFPCGRLDQVPILEINKLIENEIGSFKPDTVLTHSGKDTNNDHIIVHRSTQMATRPGAKISVVKVYSYEVLSSSEWRFTHTFSPNYFEVLEQGHVMKKWKALEVYETEIKDYPYPRSYEGIETLAKYRGLQSGNSFAEAFELIREIK